MAVTINGVEFLTTWAELKPYHIGATDTVACTCGCGLLRIARPVAKVFAAVRQAVGHALNVTSGSRCEARQIQLIKASKQPGARFTAAKNAKTATHVLCCALDWGLAGHSREAMRDIVLRESARVLGKPARVGWKSYGNGIVHADVAFLLKPNPDPINFAPGVQW